LPTPFQKKNNQSLSCGTDRANPALHSPDTQNTIFASLPPGKLSLTRCLLEVTKNSSEDELL